MSSWLLNSTNLHRLSRQIHKKLDKHDSDVPPDVNLMWGELFYDAKRNEEHRALLEADTRKSQEKIQFFATPTMLERLKHADRLFIDGTFELASKIFTECVQKSYFIYLKPYFEHKCCNSWSFRQEFKKTTKL